MTMLDDVAVADTAPVLILKDKNTKAAINYLIASGATAVQIVEIGRIVAFYTSTTIKPDAVAIHWLPHASARPVLKLARGRAGKTPDAEAAISALAMAAQELRVTLTPHDVAISRAVEAAAKLDRYFEAMRRSGQLAMFNQQYRQRRMEAVACGRGFMSWSAAMARLRAALIPLLIGNATVAPQSLFSQIFNPK